MNELDIIGEWQKHDDDEDHLGEGDRVLPRPPALPGDVGGRSGEGEDAEAAQHRDEAGGWHRLDPGVNTTQMRRNKIGV